MKEIVKCIILSHKRAEKVDTLKAVDNCSICVPEAQKEEYEQFNPGVEIIAHPDSVIGLSAKIKWVYEHYPNVMMLDDDLHSMRRMYINTDSKVPVNVAPKTAYKLIQNHAYTSRELGVKFFGYGKDPNPVKYKGDNPFGLSGFVIGGSMGFLEGFEMILPDECTSAADYYLSGINAKFHRMTFIDKRFVFSSKEGTFVSKGGMADFRNLETEKNDLLILKQAFGSSIIIKGASPTRNLQHKYERTLKINF